ncbi:MAG: histidine phosphatase family protein [bacterium]|nr:histidine phosphatase family protein [bacterium]
MGIESGNSLEGGQDKKIEKKHFGENVIIHALFIRHGEKVMSDDIETPLTSKGEKISREKGRQMSKRDAVKGYTSDTERTIATADAMVEESPTVKKMNLKKISHLSYVYDKEGSFAKEFSRQRKEILGDDFQSLSAEEQEEKIRQMSLQMTDYYLSFGDKRPDDESYSPVETAATMARVVDKYMRMADKLKSGSKVDLVNTTHDFNIAAFLKEVIIREVDSQQVTGFDSIDDIGGLIEYNDGFEALIKIDGNGQKSLKILFRGQKYDIDEDRLAELVKIAKDLGINNEDKQSK